MSYKEIDLRKAIEAVVNDEAVYMLVRMETTMTVNDLSAGEAFVVQDRVDPKLQKSVWPPKKEPTKIDHNKICALYKAKWSIQKISDEMGCSYQTVVNHLDKEGLRK